MIDKDIKKTKDFFKRNTKNRGEGREVYITPYNVIENIVDSIIFHYPELKSRVWIDPCAGDGRWEEVIKSRGIKCQSYDLQPLNDNVKQADFLIKEDYGENIFIVGNPPFSLLGKFVEKALKLTDKCYFLGGSQIITGKLSTKVDLLHRFEGFEGNQKDLRSKVLFKDTNNKDVAIWCCGALFDRGVNRNFIRKTYKTEKNFRVSIQNYCEPDDRVKVIKRGLNGGI